MRTAGVVFDAYDDKGKLLQEKTASHGGPVSFDFLSENDLSRFPDRLFALVADNRGTTFRKYAMIDGPHLASSIVYFLETGQLLPAETQIKVAKNLVNACAWYDLEPPTPLVKRAGVMNLVGGGLSAMDVANQAGAVSRKNVASMDEFRRAQAAGTKVAGRTLSLTAPQVDAIQNSIANGVSGDDDGRVLAEASKISRPAETRRKLERQLSKREQLEPGLLKQAELSGTQIMPRSALPGAPSVTGNPSRRMGSTAKIAAWERGGDLSQFTAPVRMKKGSAMHYALPHRSLYPIDTAEQLTKASSYFEEYRGALPFAERRVFAEAVLHRAEELGVKVAGAILEYGGEGYGPYIEAELVARRNSFEGTGHEAVYEALLEKKAALDPMVMVSVLFEADAETGAASAYNRAVTGFRDPYAAVHGSAKVAAEAPSKEVTYSWSQGNDYVSAAQLRDLATRGDVSLDKYFGEGFSKQYAKDPIGMFESMPDPQKVVMARMASGNTGGAARV